jgi:hypothetical protein
MLDRQADWQGTKDISLKQFVKIDENKGGWQCISEVLKDAQFS